MWDKYGLQRRVIGFSNPKVYSEIVTPRRLKLKDKILMTTYTLFKADTTNLKKWFDKLEVEILTSYLKIINGLNHTWGLTYPLISYPRQISYFFVHLNSHSILKSRIVVVYKQDLHSSTPQYFGLHKGHQCG